MGVDWLLSGPRYLRKMFFLLQGVPNSGKSLLGDFITSCFDEDAVTSLDLNALGLQFGLSEIVGKRLCLSMDLPATPWDAKAVGMLKNMTGNDLVSVDVKYQPRIRFRNTATFLFGTNHAVTTTVRDEAFFQRMVVIPFSYTVPKERQDLTLLSKLQVEKDAILTTALQAYLRLRHNRYIFSGDYQANAVISGETRAGAICLEQAIADFFYQSCVLEPKSVTFLEDLHNAFMCSYPEFMDGAVFSSRFSSFLDRSFPGRVHRDRKRKPGAKNPTSAFIGIRLGLGGVESQ